jgi:peptidoglycan/LPS O-acetylase OafA/YrhL
MSEPTHDTFQHTRHFPSLDGLRALGVLAVIWHHVVNPSGPWGFFGVSLFFGLSGFLITTLLLRERADVGYVSLGNFYMRRALRIFPLYYAVLAAYTVLVLVTEPRSGPGQQFFGHLPYFLTYTSNWFVDPHPRSRVIFYFAWSLATEEQFYLLWPSVVRFGRRWQQPVVFMTLLLLIDQAAEWYSARTPASAHVLPLRIATSVAAPICLGCLAAYATDRPGSFRPIAASLGRKWASLLLMFLLLPAVALGAPLLLTHLLLVLLVVSCCVQPAHLLSPLLANRMVRYIGSISYGMYLMHMLAFNATRRLLPVNWQSPAVTYIAVVMVTVLVAGVSFRTYERWFLGLKDRYRADSARPHRRPRQRSEDIASLPHDTLLARQGGA